MKTTLPAGEYYIGDPCYVINDWDEFCDVWFAKDHGGIFDFLAGQVCVFNTRWGDGSYTCSDGACVGVDAGIIGAIPMELVTIGHPDEDGVVVTFNEPFKCHSDCDGRLHFGEFWVMTGDEEEDEEDDD